MNNFYIYEPTEADLDAWRCDCEQRDATFEQRYEQVLGLFQNTIPAAEFNTPAETTPETAALLKRRADLLRWREEAGRNRSMLVEDEVLLEQTAYDAELDTIEASLKGGAK